MFSIDISKQANNRYLKSYDPKQESNNLYDSTMSIFLPTSEFKWIDPKGFYLNKYTSNSSKGCVLEVDLECLKESHELHNDYVLVPEKIEIKRKILSSYQLKIAGLYNIPNGNFKKLVPHFFYKEKYML